MSMTFDNQDLHAPDEKKRQPNDVVVQLEPSPETNNLPNLHLDKPIEVTSAFEAHHLTIFGYPIKQIVWSNIILLTTVHILAVYGFFYAIFIGISFWTIFFGFFLGCISGLGMSVGAHRLWAHRSYKARAPLRFILMIFQTMSGNGSIFSYARDHRTHHKYSDSSADPKNSARGFFFAHVGWWLLKKRPEVIEHGKKVKVDDMLDEWIVYYQNKFYFPLAIIWWGVVPTIIPYFLWHENLLLSHLICVHLRYVIFLHHFFTVNSIAHFWGNRPYDGQMRPTENKLVAYLSLGEGEHNYHHTFPWDYSSSRRGWIYGFNPSTFFIDCMASIGLAYDCKKPSKELVNQRINRTGYPEMFVKQPKKWRLILGGVGDWIVGFFTATWILWLGCAIKLIYVCVLIAIA